MTFTATAGAGLVQPGVHRPERKVTAVSTTDGSFLLEVARGDGVVNTTDPKLITLAEAHVRAASEVELLVVVATYRALGGRVVDRSGEPVAHARLRLQPPADFRTRFDAILDAATFPEFTTSADEAGRFLIERAPVIDGANVVATHEGFIARGTR